MTDIYQAIVDARRAGRPAALCTILLTRGSTPGKESMKMLVFADGTRIGTVGGGCVEADVAALALESLADDRARTKSFSLNQKDLPESGLICGGQITVLTEPVVPPVLILFGGGHIGAASARVASESGLRIVVADDRADYANPTAHPTADETWAGPWAESVARLGDAAHHYLVIATRGHNDDLEVLRAVHQAGCSPKYIGLLGSRAKRLTLDKVLTDEGVSADWLAQIRTPIGLDIGASTPGEIAVSLVAELINFRRKGTLGGSI